MLGTSNHEQAGYVPSILLVTSIGSESSLHVLAAADLESVGGIGNYVYTWEVVPVCLSLLIVLLDPLPRIYKGYSNHFNEEGSEFFENLKYHFHLSF